jgi:hypothetical protein
VGGACRGGHATGTVTGPTAVSSYYNCTVRQDLERRQVPWGLRTRTGQRAFRPKCFPPPATVLSGKVIQIKIKIWRTQKY